MMREDRSIFFEVNGKLNILRILLAMINKISIHVYVFFTCFIMLLSIRTMDKFFFNNKIIIN